MRTAQRLCPTSKSTLAPPCSNQHARAIPSPSSLPSASRKTRFAVTLSSSDTRLSPEGSFRKHATRAVTSEVPPLLFLFSDRTPSNDEPATIAVRVLRKTIFDDLIVPVGAGGGACCGFGSSHCEGGCTITC